MSVKNNGVSTLNEITLLRAIVKNKLYSISNYNK